MLKKILLSTAFLLPFSFTSAMADSTQWTGVYVGVVGGFQSGETKGDAVGGGSSSSTDIQGGFIGGTLGANFGHDNFVFGIEGDASWLNAEGSTTCSALPQTCTTSNEWNATLRARAGVVHNDLLFFATAGAAWAGAKSVTSPASAGTTGSYSTTINGWTFGGGVEAPVANDFRLKLEYLYTDYDTTNIPALTIGTPAFTGNSSSSQFRIGLNKSF